MRKTFQIDSHKRINGSQFDFDYKLDLSIFNGSKNLYACVSKCMIPRTYYLIRAGYNQFILRETQDTTITIPPGNYSTDTFIATLVPLLNAASVVGNQFTIVLTASTGKFTYTSTGAASIVLPTELTTAGTLHEQFGFNQGTTFALPATSANVVKFISEDTVFLRAPAFVNDTHGVLQSIVAADTADFGSISYNCPNEVLNARPLNTSNLDALHITLTDHHGVPLDTNGVPLFIELVVWQPYENIILNLIKEVFPKILNIMGI
jgi:hypothetical protein